MKRILLIVFLGLLGAGLAFAAQSSMVTRINLQTGKSVEGGIAVNPVTHKAYVIAELATEGADDEKVVFVLDESVLKNAKAAAKSISLPSGSDFPALKFIPIPNENEYLTIDSTKNLIYVATKFSVESEESDDGVADDGSADPPGGDGTSESGSTATGTQNILIGTLTVIDGNTDTVIATWYFPQGVEPEGVAVDVAKSIVYVGAKAPEGEAGDDDYCSSGVPIFDVGEPADVECWTSGSVYAFLVDRAATPVITYLKTIPAGDDPESIVFENGMIYAANEDDGTVTIASAVNPDGTGGVLLTDPPIPPMQPYELGIAPYKLGVFYKYGANPLACAENKFEADKMASGGGSVFITDDRSRVAKITGISVGGMLEVPGATACQAIPNTDGGGANTANNIGFMSRDDGGTGILYAVSEQNTLAIINPNTMKLRDTITIPGALHLDGIAVDNVAHRVWLTDEELQAVFVVEGACINGVGTCAK